MSESAAAQDQVQREVASVMKALAPMVGTKEQSDACIALGRLAAWAETGLSPVSDAARCDCFALSGSCGAHDLACPNAAAQDLLPCTCHSDDLEPYCPRHTPDDQKEKWARGN